MGERDFFEAQPYRAASGNFSYGVASVELQTQFAGAPWLGLISLVQTAGSFLRNWKGVAPRAAAGGPPSVNGPLSRK